MSAFFGLLLIVVPMMGAVAYQLLSGKLLGRNWKPYTTRTEHPVLYWMAISVETAGALAVLYGVLHASH